MADNKVEPKTIEQKADLSKPLTVQDLATLLPSMMAAVVTATQAQRPAAQATPGQLANKPKCHECGQVKTGCEGKHIRMAVTPRDFGDYFPGVFLNGVRYFSDHENQLVTVPASAESAILGILAGYEKNEKELATGRKAVRHSGVVSPSGSRTTEQHSAWR